MKEDVLYHMFSPHTNGIDKLINQVVVPKSIRGQILSDYHDSLIGGAMKDLTSK